MTYIIIIMLIMATFVGGGLIRKRSFKELAAFSVLWLIATAYALLVATRVPLPSPVEMIIQLIDAIMS
ncbi:MAG: hypothetical protein GX767_02330 [Firmicutes bacterium]|nr:hypothetical protein [Bacillota bacterium]